MQSDRSDSPTAQENMGIFTGSEAEELEAAKQLTPDASDALRSMLQERLQECGWRDNIRKMIRAIMEERGPNNISYEDIVIEVVPKARAMVPEEVREELQMRMRESLSGRSNSPDK